MYVVRYSLNYNTVAPPQDGIQNPEPSEVIQNVLIKNVRPFNKKIYIFRDTVSLRDHSELMIRSKTRILQSQSWCFLRGTSSRRRAVDIL
jgi:hypothetical protein